MNVPTGVFVSSEEREAVQLAYDTSGMFLSGGRPIGNPEREVDSLVKKYGMAGCALNLKTGEFIRIGGGL